MSMELGPYTNFHELNLDWFLNEFNKVLAEWASMNKSFSDLNAAFNDLRNYVHDYFNDLDVQEEIDNKLDSMAKDGSLYAIIRKYTDPIVNEQNSKITVLENRMNTFASLPEGSTSGDAELIDIRVPADGFNGNSDYPSAGDAVRGQVSALKGELDYLEKSKNLCFKFSKTNCNVKGYYAAEPSIKGLGFYAKNIPQYIESIKVNCNCNANGTVKLDILDSNKNEIFTTSTTVTNYTSGVQTLIFNVNEFIYEEKIWIRVYSDTVSIGRCEPSALNTKIVDTSHDYACYLVNGNWNYSSYYNYIPECTIIGYIGKKSLFVGTNSQFKKIKDAVDYANDNINSGWDIFVDSGTYDLYSEFGGDNWYSAITPEKGNMQGLSLDNNINLIGVGDVKLVLNPPDSLATTTNVPNLSVIELQNENNEIKNITIECKNVRYGIHDETDGKKPNSKRKLKNVSVTHNGCVSGTWNAPVSYGCGTSDNSHFEYENCEFKNGWLAHPNKSQTILPKFYANNCIFKGGSYAISLNSSGSCKAEITINNCFIDYMIRILENENIWSIYGSGNNDFNYTVIGDVSNQLCYKLYDKVYCKKASINIPRLKAVTIGTDGKLTKASNKNDCIGILINGIDTTEIGCVIKKGFVNVYTFSPFSDGDLIGVAPDGSLVVDNNNPIAKAVTVDGIQQIYVF